MSNNIIMTNEFIKSQFKLLSNMYYERSDNHRSMTFYKVSNIIEVLPFIIVDANQLKGIRGIGDGTLKRVKELLQTGQLGELLGYDAKSTIKEPINQTKIEVIKDPSTLIIEEFSSIYGVGDKIAKKWYGMGYTSLEQIATAGLFTRAQTIGYKHKKDIDLRIPREEINKIKEKVENELAYLNAQYACQLHMFIAGSYCRGMKDSGDIDILIVELSAGTSTQAPMTSHYMGMVIQHLVNKGILLETLAMGNSKYLGLGRLDEKSPVRRIDFEIVNDVNNWYTYLNYFIGDQDHNRMMRERAKQYGYVLNEHALLDQQGNKIQIFSEPDLYRKLGLSYIYPEQRCFLNQLKNEKKE